MDETVRYYKFKDEELAPICKLAAVSLKRDFPDFHNYSPVFTDEYLKTFSNKTDAVSEIAEPEAETQQKKEITKAVNQAMESLRGPTHDLIGYLGLAKLSPAVSEKDFGLSQLLISINKGDAEAVVKSAHIVKQNIDSHKAKLTEVGLSEEEYALFTEVPKLISDKKTEQGKIEDNRARIVEQNIGLFNELYLILKEIFKIGKIIFTKKESPAIKEEYTLTQVLKKFRKAKKEEKKNPPTDSPSDIAGALS